MRALYSFQNKSLLAVTHDAGRTWTVAETIKKGGKIIVTAIRDGVANFRPRGRVQLSVGARQSYILRQEFPTKDRKLLNLQVSRKLKQIGLWSDADTLHTALISEQKPNGQNLVTAIAVPGSEFDPVLEKLSSAKGARPQSIFPCEAAIAGLLGEITSDPVLSLYFSTNYVKILLTIRKIPLFVQLIPVSEEGLGENLLEYNIEKALDQAHKVYNGSVEKIVAFGSIPDELPSVIGEFNLWKPKWQEIIQSDQPDAITKHPALFGTPFTDPGFDMRPSNWKLAYNLQKASAIAAGLAVAGTAFFSTCSLLLHSYNLTLQKRQSDYAAALNKREKALLAHMPSPRQIKGLYKWVELNQKYAEEPNLNVLMGLFAQCLPPEVKILDMKITREGRVSKTTQVPPENLDQPSPLPATETSGHAIIGPLEVIGTPWESEFTLVTRGNFSLADARLKNTIAKLQLYFRLKDVSRTYDETKQRGILSFKMTAKGKQQSS